MIKRIIYWLLGYRKFEVSYILYFKDGSKDENKIVIEELSAIQAENILYIALGRVEWTDTILDLDIISVNQIK